MRIIERDDAKVPEDRAEFDKRQVEWVSQGACFLCEGWGYPFVDLSPEKINGKWACRIRAAACDVCGGSGLNPKTHSAAEMDAGRAYHRDRFDKLVQWTARRAEREFNRKAKT